MLVKYFLQISGRHLKLGNNGKVCLCSSKFHNLDLGYFINVSLVLTEFGYHIKSLLFLSLKKSVDLFMYVRERERRGERSESMYIPISWFIL